MVQECWFSFSLCSHYRKALEVAVAAAVAHEDSIQNQCNARCPYPCPKDFEWVYSVSVSDCKCKRKLLDIHAVVTFIGQEWIRNAMDNINDFRAGLRWGAYDVYETFVLKRVKEATRLTLKCKSLSELEAYGLSNPFDVLTKALESFVRDIEAKTLLEQLQAWFATLKGELLQTQLAEIAQSGLDSGHVDVQVLDAKLGQLKGVQFSADLKKSLFELAPAVCRSLYEKAHLFFFEEQTDIEFENVCIVVI